jgi:hypothetical protein
MQEISVVDLAICAIMKNEGSYIREWLSFHHAVGVRRFFLYNNNSQDNTLLEIAAWPFRDMVTVIDWPQIPGQISAYQHTIQNFRGEAQWCAFIDCDEFITPQSSFDITALLKSLRPICSGLYVHWLMFGSSRILNREPGLVTERFVMRGHASFGPNSVGKTIVRMDAAIEPANPHIIRCQGRLINDNNEEIDQNNHGFHGHPSHRYIALNHYFTKSKSEWNARRSIGKADKVLSDGDFRRTSEEFDRHDVNDVLDRRAADIIAPLKDLYGL